MSAQDVVLRLDNLSKTYGRNTVLTGFRLALTAGEVHGLIGQNGAGKSTVVKILSGIERPDPGAVVELDGVPVEAAVRHVKPPQRQARFVHQDLGLVGSMTISENMLLGFNAGPKGGWRLRKGMERRNIADSLAEFGLLVSPDTMVNRLSVSDRAVVAIVRAFASAARHGEAAPILILDEPTAYLPIASRDRLFTAVKQAARRGSGVLLISHSLKEIREITDRVTVLRDGVVVACLRSRETDEIELAALMLGEALVPSQHAGLARPSRAGPLLQVRDLGGRQLHGVTFTVAAGEVLGVTGLLGMGQDELPYLIGGLRPRAYGEAVVNGQRVPPDEPRRALALGICVIPADRSVDGVDLAASAAENVSLPVLRKHFRHGRLDKRAIEAETHRLMTSVGVRPAEPARRLGSFSGGNQQRIVLAKWLQTDPKVLVLHQPTQGVDVGARQAIVRILKERAASATTATLVCSSDFTELEELCDRVLVLSQGKVVAELMGDQVTEPKIAASAYLGEAETGIHDNAVVRDDAPADDEAAVDSEAVVHNEAREGS